MREWGSMDEDKKALWVATYKPLAALISEEMKGMDASAHKDPNSNTLDRILTFEKTLPSATLKALHGDGVLLSPPAKAAGKAKASGKGEGDAAKTLVKLSEAAKPAAQAEAAKPASQAGPSQAVKAESSSEEESEEEEEKEKEAEEAERAAEARRLKKEKRKRKAEKKLRREEKRVKKGEANSAKKSVKMSSDSDEED